MLIHLANMMCKTTTVALYDTLGVDATRFVIDQTKMITICTSGDLVGKIIDMKKADDAGDDKKCHRLKNIVSFEKCPPETL